MNIQSTKDFFRKNERATYTVIVIVLMLLAAFYLMRGQGVNAPKVENNEGGTVISETLNENTVLAVRNQEAGASVVIEKLALTKKSWVAVHEDKNGVPGIVLGAIRLRPENATGTVGLIIRNTDPGETYYVVVHIDDGDDAFNYKTDIPELVDGKELSVAFQTLGSIGVSTTTTTTSTL